MVDKPGLAEYIQENVAKEKKNKTVRKWLLSRTVEASDHDRFSSKDSRFMKRSPTKHFFLLPPDEISS